MSDVPLSVILSWPEPNFDDPETHGKGFLAGSIVLAVAGCTAVGLRLWARFGVVRKPGPDDYLIVFALLIALALTVSALLLVYRYGSDRHNWDTSYDWIVPYSLTSWIGFQLYLLNQGVIKVSILFLYRHILLRSFSRINQYINWALIVIVTAYTLAFYFLNVFQCDPVDAAWLRLRFPDLYTKEWTCVDSTYTLFVSSVVSAVFDFIIAAFPILFLHQLHLPKRQKCLLIIIFGLVFVVCAAGIMRIISLHKLLYSTYDKTWYGYYHHLWTAIEIWLAIICACAPVLKPLVRRHIGSSEEIGNLLSASWSRIRNLEISSGSRSKQQLSKDSLQPTQASMAETRHDVTLNSNFDDGYDGHHESDGYDGSRNSQSPNANSSLTALPALVRPSRPFSSIRPRTQSPQPLPSLKKGKNTTVANNTATTSTIQKQGRLQPRLPLQLQVRSQSKSRSRSPSRPQSQLYLDDQREAYSRFRFRDSLTSSRPLSSLSSAAAMPVGVSATAPAPAAPAPAAPASTTTRPRNAVISSDRSGESRVVDFRAEAPPRLMSNLYSPDEYRQLKTGLMTPRATPKTAPPRVESPASGNGSLGDGSISERVFLEKSFYYP